MRHPVPAAGVVVSDHAAASDHEAVSDHHAQGSARGIVGTGVTATDDGMSDEMMMVVDMDVVVHHVYEIWLRLHRDDRYDDRRRGYDRYDRHDRDRRRR